MLSPDFNKLTTAEILRDLKQYDHDNFCKLIHHLAQKFQGMVNARAPDREFHNEINFWLEALMNSGRPAYDILGAVYVWLVEYDLPIMPTKTPCFDEFHKNYGKFIFNGDKTWQQKLDLYLSAEYRQKPRAEPTKNSVAEWDIKYDDTTDNYPRPPGVIKQYLNKIKKIINKQTTYKHYKIKNTDGSYTYRTYLYVHTPWQVFVNWVKQTLQFK